MYTAITSVLSVPGYYSFKNRQKSFFLIARNFIKGGMYAMSSQYEVLRPWADAEPVPLLGLSPRLPDLAGKKIGLFTLTYKHASARVNSVVEKKLKERFPTAEFRYFERSRGADIDIGQGRKGEFMDPAQDSQDLARFEDWVKGVDAVVGAVGD
jgi:hypothetical protein